MIGAVPVAYISLQKRSCIGTKLGLGALCERRNSNQAVLFTVQMMIPDFRIPRTFLLNKLLLSRREQAAEGPVFASPDLGYMLGVYTRGPS